jgi:hypothetical protein
MMRSKEPHTMDGLKEGDWVRTEMGQDGKLVVMSADGVRAYVERGQTSILGVRLFSFPVATLQKIDPPKPGDKS